MTFRTLLVMTAFLAPMVGQAADEKDKPADLSIVVKVGTIQAIAIHGAKEARAVDKNVAQVSIGESNQIIVEGLGLGETTAQVSRKGEQNFKLAIQVVR